MNSVSFSSSYRRPAKVPPVSFLRTSNRAVSLERGLPFGPAKPTFSAQSKMDPPPVLFASHQETASTALVTALKQYLTLQDDPSRQHFLINQFGRFFEPNSIDPAEVTPVFNENDSDSVVSFLRSVFINRQSLLNSNPDLVYANLDRRLLSGFADPLKVRRNLYGEIQEKEKGAYCLVLLPALIGRVLNNSLALNGDAFEKLTQQISFLLDQLKAIEAQTAPQTSWLSLLPIKAVSSLGSRDNNYNIGKFATGQLHHLTGLDENNTKANILSYCKLDLIPRLLALGANPFKKPNIHSDTSLFERAVEADNSDLVRLYINGNCFKSLDESEKQGLLDFMITKWSEAIDCSPGPSPGLALPLPPYTPHAIYRRIAALNDGFYGGVMMLIIHNSEAKQQETLLQTLWKNLQAAGFLFAANEIEIMLLKKQLEAQGRRLRKLESYFSLVG